jgi:alpha/beta hydrolase fold
MREAAALARSLAAPPPFPPDAGRGRGQTVIVLPGFCSPEFATARLRSFLTRQGFAARSWQCGPNFGPMRGALVRFERLLAETADSEGAPVALVGVSLGGTLAREIAKRHPRRVACVVTLASPIRIPVVSPLAPLAHAAALAWDSDARAYLATISEPPPVPLTAIVSRTDGLVEWHGCLPETAAQVETVIIEGAHMTIASNPEAQRIVADRLARIA